jgi:hypothetical protein
MTMNGLWSAMADNSTRPTNNEQQGSCAQKASAHGFDLAHERMKIITRLEDLRILSEIWLEDCERADGSVTHRNR